MGAAYELPNRLVEVYVPEEEQGCRVKLDYEISTWAAFWLKLNGADLSPYTQLVFDVRADSDFAVPQQMKVELKRFCRTEGVTTVCDQGSTIYVSGITQEWRSVSVDLSDFGPAGFSTPLSSLAEMEELVFTFEANRAGPSGVVYLDDIAFR